MAIVSFVDDNSRLGVAFLNRNYAKLSQELQSEKNNYTHVVECGESMYAFNVTRNFALSKLYEGDFFVVRFVLCNVDTFHSEEQKNVFEQLFKTLDLYMGANPGYYNIRIPTHIVDMVRTYNKFFKDGYFCGGTVEYVCKDREIHESEMEGVSTFWASEEYIRKFEKRLLEISYKSFEEYQGQYHISPVTDVKAGIVYEDWLANSFKDYKGNVVVGDYDGLPVGFVLVGEDDFSVEIVLNAVDSSYRKFGVYRRMIEQIINYAKNKNKAVVTSTQFDNFVVQGVWASMGFKPFYSIYNVHVDRRRKK